MVQKIVWDKTGERTYETGVDHGVLYPMDENGAYSKGVAWNGLTTVTEKPSGAAATPLYADNIKYLNLISAEEFGATIEAYTYPDEFAVCDGSAEPTPGLILGQQTRKVFGLAYRSVMGNDVDGQDYGYKLHLIYNALAAPSEKGYATINDSPSAIAFSWEIATTPVAVATYKPTASLIVDSTKVDPTKLAALETILYGTEGGADGYLPLPDAVVALLTETAPSVLALSSIAPADDSSGVAKNANIVLTFNNKIASEAIVVASAAGAIVSVVRTWDSAGKVLTLNPGSDLTGSTTYLVTVGGVVDIYNQVLASEVKNFATIA